MFLKKKLNNFCVFILLNDIFFLQFIVLITLLFYSLTINILTSWLLAGIYLLFLGNFLLLDDIDIFVGFLWVLDLGVGLVFFIFILYFSEFLFFKVKLDINSRFFFNILFLFFFILFFFFIFAAPADKYYISAANIWFFLITYYDFYLLHSIVGLIDLNILKEIYFYFNSFEFFIINFVVFYGIVSSILTLFLIYKLLILSNYYTYYNSAFLLNITTSFIIRTQNFIKQKTTSAGSRVWFKSKKL